ncbi:hypothetical protein Nmel_018069, partial [Mimus melanotis]
GVESGAADWGPWVAIPYRPTAGSEQSRSHPETHPGSSRETPVPYGASGRGQLAADHISQEAPRLRPPCALWLCLCVRAGQALARAVAGASAGKMDDEEETYRLWKIRKTIMQVRGNGGTGRAEPGVRRVPQTLRGRRVEVGDVEAGLPARSQSGRVPEPSAAPAALPRPRVPGDPGRAGPDAGGIQGAVRGQAQRGPPPSHRPDRAGGSQR